MGSASRACRTAYTLNARVTAEWHNGLVVINLGENENTFNEGSFQRFHAVLDEVDKVKTDIALVTVSSGKHWSNGYDLPWVSDPTSRAVAAKAGHALLARLLSLGRPTVAAIRGHAFGFGAMLALAHDIRVMREDRGYLCLPEVDLGLVFTPGMTTFLSTHLTPAVAHRAMALGQRFPADEAMSAGMVEQIAPDGAVLDTAIDAARKFSGRDPATMAAIKRGLHASTLRLLEADTPTTDA